MSKLLNKSLQAWFRTYRGLKRCFLNQPAQPGVKRLSLYDEFSVNRITFATSFAILVGAVALNVILPPYLSAPPLAILGCSLLAVVVSGRWGTIAAICYCAALLMAQILCYDEPAGMATLLWNLLMRFLFLEIYVVLFDFVRRQVRPLAER